MKTKLVQIGNSKGVRIPKPLIEQAGLSEDIELILKGNEIILRSANGPRKDWEQAFKKMAERGDDQLLNPETDESPNNWDETEWTW
jgi:antitoxin MazE